MHRLHRGRDRLGIIIKCIARRSVICDEDNSNVLNVLTGLTLVISVIHEMYKIIKDGVTCLTLKHFRIRRLAHLPDRRVRRFTIAIDMSID